MRPNREACQRCRLLASKYKMKTEKFYVCASFFARRIVLVFGPAMYGPPNKIFVHPHVSVRLPFVSAIGPDKHALASRHWVWQCVCVSVACKMWLRYICRRKLCSESTCYLNCISVFLRFRSLPGLPLSLVHFIFRSFGPTVILCRLYSPNHIYSTNERPDHTNAPLTPPRPKCAFSPQMTTGISVRAFCAGKFDFLAVGKLLHGKFIFLVIYDLVFISTFFCLLLLCRCFFCGKSQKPKILLTLCAVCCGCSVVSKALGARVPIGKDFFMIIIITRQCRRSRWKMLESDCTEEKNRRAAPSSHLNNVQSHHRLNEIEETIFVRISLAAVWSRQSESGKFLRETMLPIERSQCSQWPP